MSITYCIPVGLFLLIQVAWLLVYFTRIPIQARKSKRRQPADSTPADTPISVVIISDNQVEQLEKNLPSVLQQDYPGFEVIVVYNESSLQSTVILENMHRQYGNLHFTFVPENKMQLSHRKLAVLLGMKAARYDWVVFTTPCCRPASSRWLHALADNFTAGTDIVLAYSNYSQPVPFRNRFMQYSVFYDAVKSMSSAILRLPYTGKRYNLAFRKEVYLRMPSLQYFLKTQQGEADLFVNTMANHRNCRVALSPDSITRMDLPGYSNEWREEKIDEVISRRYMFGTGLRLAHWETGTHILFLLSVIVTAMAGIMLHDPMLIYVSLGAWLFRSCIQCILLILNAKVFGEPLNCFRVMAEDILMPLRSLCINLRARKS